MSSPPWYMHLYYGKSLPLQMCTRNRISPPKDVHKSHIKMTKHSDIYSLEYTLPLFVRNRQMVKKTKWQEMKVRTMLMMHGKMKLKPKTI